MNKFIQTIVLIIGILGLAYPLLYFFEASFEPTEPHWYHYIAVLLPHQLGFFIFDGVSIMALSEESRVLSVNVNPFNSFFYLLLVVSFAINLFRPNTAKNLVALNYLVLGLGAFAKLIHWALFAIFYGADFFKNFNDPIFIGVLLFHVCWILVSTSYLRGYIMDLRLLPNTEPISVKEEKTTQERWSAREQLEQFDIAQNETTVFEKASKSQRFLHLIIDLFIFLLLFSYSLRFFSKRPEFGESAETYFFVWLLLCRFLYYLVSEALFGLTPAKLITSTVVASPSGEKPKFSNIFSRTLTRFVPFESLTFLFSQGLHDKLSNTYPAKTTHDKQNKKTDALIFAVILVSTIAFFTLIQFR